jgi:glycine betaine/proline transport system substrate-binding protein
MKLRTIAAAVVFAASFSGGIAKADACGEVSITEMNWASSAVVTAVSKFIMEQGYGCSVKLVPSSTNPALASVAETGEPDILTELWVNGSPSYDKLKAQGKVKPLTEVLSDGGVEGWWVPKYLADAHPELKTIAGVKANPKLVGARFHNCPDGWACQRINANNARGAGLEASGIEVFKHGSGETLAASIAAAFANKEPWFGYYWAPTSILGKYEMTRVDVGPFNAEAHACNSKDDCANPKLSPFPASTVLTVVTDKFANENPTITSLMKNVSFTNAQMGEVLAWQEENKASADEAAVYFLNKYSNVWSKWLNDDARKKLKALIK